MTKNSKRGAPRGSDGEEPPGAREPGPAGDAFPMHEHIGRHLKALFDDTVAQPVPDRFRELLDQLERKRPKT